MSSPQITAALMGVLVGVICVGGMLAGVWLILKPMEPGSADSGKKGLYYVGGGLILALQLVLAAGILTKTTWIKEQPIAMGGGMIATILLLSLILNPLVKSGKK